VQYYSERLISNTLYASIKIMLRGTKIACQSDVVTTVSRRLLLKPLISKYIVCTWENDGLN